MSKSSSNDLQDLIYSLSTGELVYFKKYAKRYCDKDSVYLNLFDSIKAIEHPFSLNQETNKLFTNKQRFAEHKFYLYNLILESLTAYHKHNRVDFQVRDMISKAIILMNKKLFSQALKIIEQAKELIQKNNLSYVINEVLALEGTIKMELFKEPNIIKYFKDLFTTCRNNTQKMNNLTNLLEVRYVTKSLYCKYGILTHIADAETLAYCNNKLNEININLLSPIEKLIYFSNAVNLYPHGKPETEYHKLFTKLKQLYEENKTFIQQHTHNYLYMISNSVTRYIIFNNKLEIEKNFNLLKSMNKDKGIFSERYFSTLISSNILYYDLTILLKDRKNIEAYTLLINTKKTLFIGIDTLPVRIQLRNYYLFGLIYFYNGKYEEALDWFNKIFDYSIARLDLQLLARMYEVACHVELNNKLLVEHKLISLYRFGKKNLPTIKQVSVYAKFIKALLDDTNKYKNKKNLNYLELNLTSLCKQERIDEFGFDIAIFCISKNNNINFSDAYDYNICSIQLQQEKA
jgi:tetratricopeptide (TPR) repeat protein